MSSREFWDNVHSGKRAEEVSWYTPEAATSMALISESNLACNVPTLDVGAGVGFLVDRLLDQGFSNVFALDISEKALEATKSRLGERSSDVTWIVGDILEADLPQVLLWHDRAVFHFLTDDTDRARYVARLGRHVMPGGYAVIATFAEDGPERCSGLPVRRHSVEQLTQTFLNDFEFVRSERETHHTPSGTPQHFNYVLLRHRG